MKSRMCTFLSIALLSINFYTADAVPLGKGAYTTTLPAGQIGPSNMNFQPVTPKVTSTFNKPATSNNWWSSLIWQFTPDNPYSENLFADPLGFQATQNGLLVFYPTYVAITGDITAAKGEKLQEYHYQPQGSGDFTVGITNLSATATQVADYSDWTVTAQWQDSARTLKATIGHGLPFAYFTLAGGPALINFKQVPTIWYNKNGTLGITINRNNYGIFAPTGSVWTGTQQAQSTLNGKDYLSIAVLPDNNEATLLDYQKHAFAFVTDTQISWNYNQETAQVATNFAVTTELKENNGTSVNSTLQALYRHQWMNTSNALANYSYGSARGQMKVFDGNQFSTILQFNGVVPELPMVAQDGKNGFDKNKLYSYVDQVYQQTPTARWSNITIADTYSYGKAFGRIALLTKIADQVGHTQARDLFLQETKARLNDWFDGKNPQLFYYDNTWKTVIGYPASFGSDFALNDHHFHYGYFIQAAATVALYDKTWANDANYGKMVKLLIKDPANSDRGTTQFPFLRFFDMYAGHGWASGPSNFAAGNNQESSSEAMNFITGVILWASATDDMALRDLGLFLYANHRAAIEQYWFDINDIVFPEGFTKPTLGILWGNGGAYAVFWDAYVEEVHGINFLPITGGSLYLGRNPDYLRLNQAFMKSNHGGNDMWRDIHFEVQALYDPAAAAQALNTTTYTPEAGESPAHTYHWVHNLNALGVLDTAVTANYPHYAVFSKNGARNYIAHNPTDQAITVNFSDSATLNVPANSYASNLNVIPVNPGQHIDRPDFTIDISADNQNVTIVFTPKQATAFVDIHYAINANAPVDKRLIFVNNRAQIVIPNISTADTLSYSFSYEKADISYCSEIFTYQQTNPSAQWEDVDGYSRKLEMIIPTQLQISFKRNNLPKYVDLHYTINGKSPQQNFRMTNKQDIWSFIITNLKATDKVNYSFTYEQSGLSHDTGWTTYTVQ